jgi:hypothetical protein
MGKLTVFNFFVIYRVLPLSLSLSLFQYVVFAPLFVSCADWLAFGVGMLFHSIRPIKHLPFFLWTDPLWTVWYLLGGLLVGFWLATAMVQLQFDAVKLWSIVFMPFWAVVLLMLPIGLRYGVIE